MKAKSDVYEMSNERFFVCGALCVGVCMYARACVRVLKIIETYVVYNYDL